MFFLLLTGISFFLFLKSLTLKPLPPWANDTRFLPLCFWKGLSVSFYPICKPIKGLFFGGVWGLPFLAMKQGSSSSKLENVEYLSGHISVLDLPELALECILEKLSPATLCSMAGVCSSLRERCTSDHLWERHMKQKWGKIFGPAVYREWQWFIAHRRNKTNSELKQSQNLLESFVCKIWPFSWFSSKYDKKVDEQIYSPMVDSVMSCYLALETGKFWFPAQVYNRENGHVGFMLSCYDARLSYDAQTDTFQARYPPHGRRTIALESGVQWERLRSAPVDTSPNDLHISDCLDDLHPGDHIEIQWRRNKEFPYGWWYGVVGHLETCDGNENYCRCHNSDTVALEFNQYTPGSRWRRAVVSRKDHKEVGNETDGFYGGIRKLYKNNEVATWTRLWPREILE